MSQFYPFILGGILIGLASGVFLIFNGRIMGVSGILGDIFHKGSFKQKIDQYLFVAGMLISPIIYLCFTPLPKIEVSNNIVLLLVSGFMVGFGSRLGSGCTSGHGVCGLGRFSKRSFVAVAIFMITAIAIVFVKKHIFFLE